MAKTVVGLTDRREEAERVVQDLATSGFQRESITLRGSGALGREEGEQETASFLEQRGVPESDAEYYAEGLRRGGTLVVVTADDASAGKAVDIMTRHGAIDIDKRAETWRREGWTGLSRERSRTQATPQQPSAAREREGVIPVVEEEIQVGKRQVQTGGVRVYSHIVEKPVEEQVTLREERAKVERRPADRPASAAEREAFKEQSFEIRETAEEPVISKEARVKEEVVVGKEAAQRTERVRETVRRTDVEVEKTGQQRVEAIDEADFERHFRSAYGARGEGYESYRSAYHYAESRSADPRFRNKDWMEVEEDIHRDWESSHPGTWGRFRDAIHYGWDKTRKH